MKKILAFLPHCYCELPISHTMNRKIYSALISLSVIFSFNVHAEGLNDTVIVKDVSYDYNLKINATTGKPTNCDGEITLTIIYPQGTKKLYIQGTSQNSIITPPFFGRLEERALPETYGPLTTSFRARWNTLFRIRCFVNSSDDETKNLYSEIYEVNSFITPDDLAKLKDAAGLDVVEMDDVDIKIADGQLTISAFESTEIMLYDLMGICQFSGLVNGTYTLNLNRFSSQILILKCNNSRQSITKKIIHR